MENVTGKLDKIKEQDTRDVVEIIKGYPTLSQIREYMDLIGHSSAKTSAVAGENYNSRKDRDAMDCI